MSKKKMYIEMDATYAEKMISEVSACPDKMKTVDISRIPFNSEFPTSYTDKCQYATYATSACSDSQTNLILIYNRKDHNEMDQDMFAFYYNPKDNSHFCEWRKIASWRLRWKNTRLCRCLFYIKCHGGIWFYSIIGSNEGCC